VYLNRGGTSGNLSSALSPTLAGTKDAYDKADLALDSNGNPGIVYYLGAPYGSTSPEWNNKTLAFWMPGQDAVKVTDCNNIQNDDPSVSLAFFGTKPRIAYHLTRESSQSLNDIWFSSSDDGLAWNDPVRVPKDNLDGTSWWESLTIDSLGNAAIAAYFGSSSASGPGLFGGPKLHRSTDLNTWTVSSPDSVKLPGFAGRHVITRFTTADKLYMVFHYNSVNSSVPAGVIFWREE
jgi:hypothetical protein